MAGAGRLDAWLRKTGIAQQLAEALYGGSQLQLDDPHHHQEPLIIQVDALSAVSEDVELGSMLLNATGWGSRAACSGPLVTHPAARAAARRWLLCLDLAAGVIPHRRLPARLLQRR
jgi:hypothetical protein